MNLLEIDLYFKVNSFKDNWQLLPKQLSLNGKNFLIDKELKTIQAESSNYLSSLVVNDILIVNSEFFITVKSIIDDFNFEYEGEFSSILTLEKVLLSSYEDTKNLIEYKKKIVRYCHESIVNSNFYVLDLLDVRFFYAVYEYCFFIYEALEKNTFEKKDSLENVKKYKLGDMEYEFLEKSYNSNINNFSKKIQDLLFIFLPTKVINLSRKYE